MEQKIIRDFILNRGQQVFIGILLSGAIIASSILILRRANEENRLKIEVSKGEFPKNSLQSPVHAPKTINEENRLKIEVSKGEFPKNSLQSPVHAPNIKNRPKQERLMININKADKDELIKLPGIGPKLAERILEYRKKNGPFYEKEDIMKVSGIGLKKFEKCKDMITID